MEERLDPTPRRADWRWLFFVVAAVAIAFDQWTKAAIIDWLPLHESWRPFAGTPLLELFAFTHIKNSGAAFGMLQQGGWLFAAIAVAVTIAILVRFPSLPRHKAWLFAGLGLVQAGALGNLIDRLRLGGAVTDFIHIGNFAIFNVADAAIFCGVILLSAMMWREERAEEEAARRAALPAEQHDEVGA